jgi:hypothetical protein
MTLEEAARRGFAAGWLAANEYRRSGVGTGVKWYEAALAKLLEAIR